MLYLPHIQLRIDRNFCSVHEEITSIRLYTPYNPRSELRKGVYEHAVISPEWGKDRVVITTKGTYRWSFMTQVLPNG
jgi:hypothetical protein